MKEEEEAKELMKEIFKSLGIELGEMEVVGTTKKPESRAFPDMDFTSLQEKMKRLYAGANTSRDEKDFVRDWGFAPEQSQTRNYNIHTSTTGPVGSPSRGEKVEVLVNTTKYESHTTLDILMPGIHKHTINIAYKPLSSIMHITAKRKHLGRSTLNRNAAFEIHDVDFTVKVSFPVVASGISATYEDGILTIKLPREASFNLQDMTILVK